LPDSDQREVHSTILGLILDVAHLTYLTTLSHANLMHWLAVRDSVRHELGVDAAIRPDSLVGKPAPQITGEYWFNTTTPAPMVPAPGRVSLIVFDNPDAGVTQKVDSRVFGELRQLHTMFPDLQIVLVATTQGSFRGKYLMTHPDSEAALIHHYFDTLQVPGILCVAKSTYRTVVGGQAIPLGTPVLDAYKLDPRGYSNRYFLVDAQGWVVSQDLPSSLDDEEFIRRLLAHTGQRSASVVAESMLSESIGSDRGAVTQDTIVTQDTATSSPQTPDSGATPARRKPVRFWPWPTDVLLHGITLTTQQQDSLQRLIVDQKARAEEVSRLRRSHERSIQSAAQIDPVLFKADSIQAAAMRNTNRAQFKAVLTPEQQRQFDRNVLKVEDEVAKQGVRQNWWW
jgi:hypothetical protein